MMTMATRMSMVISTVSRFSSLVEVFDNEDHSDDNEQDAVQVQEEVFVMQNFMCAFDESQDHGDYRRFSQLRHASCWSHGN
jgi:hypothetical protein